MDHLEMIWPGQWPGTATVTQQSASLRWSQSPLHWRFSHSMAWPGLTWESFQAYSLSSAHWSPIDHCLHTPCSRRQISPTLITHLATLQPSSLQIQATTEYFSCDPSLYFRVFFCISWIRTLYLSDELRTRRLANIESRGEKERPRREKEILWCFSVCHLYTHWRFCFWHRRTCW